MRNF
jgi:hypothetical protein